MTQSPVIPRKKVTDQERALVDLAHRLGEGWSAVYIHLSKISKAKRNENIVFALQMFEEFIRPYDGHFLIMKNGDWVFVYRDIRIAEIKSATARLRRLFAGDPIYYCEEKSESAFATWYDLDRDRSEFARLAEMLLAEKMVDPTPAAAEAPVATADDRLRRKAAELVSLGRILDAIERSDLASVLRRQPVCLIEGGGRPRDLFEEVYFSIADLEALLRRGSLMTGDAWIFQSITRVLDLKLLTMLAPERGAKEPPNVSINLNVSSVVAPEFLEFDQRMDEGAKRSMAVEFQFTDVFADVGAFLYARSLLRERGYPVLLDGITDINLSFVDRGRMGVDLLKVRWGPAMTEDRFRADFARFAGADDVRQVVLCRCDGERALEVGAGLGITLYQGRHVSALLSPGSAEPPFLASLRVGAITAA